MFRVFGVTSFPAAQRAQAIADRIRALAEDRSESTDSLRLVEAEHSSDILAGDQLIMSVVNADARIEGGGNPRRLIAQLHLNRIKTAVADYRAERNPALLLHNAIIAAGYTLLLAVALFVIFHAVRWVTAVIERSYQSAVKRIETGSFQLVSAASIWKLVHIAFRILSLMVALFLVLVELHFVLSLFPWTRGAQTTFERSSLLRCS